jgi:8-amino-7-oxononanoate synthase
MPTGHHFGMPDAADIVMGTFSKSFASLGGYVASTHEVIHYIKHKSRAFIFSAAMSPASVGTVLECLKIVQEEPEHLENLWRNAQKVSRELQGMGYNTLGSRTPVVPLLVGDDYAAFSFAQKLYENGVFATPVVSPAVPEGCALLRTSYMASHSEAELDYALGVLERLGREFGILGSASRRDELELLAQQHFGAKAAVV